MGLRQRVQVPPTVVRAWGDDHSAEELLQPSDALHEVVVTERIGETKVSWRPERLTGHGGHLNLVEDQLRELGRRGGCDAVHLPAQEPLDRRVGVERAL